MGGIDPVPLPSMELPQYRVKSKSPEYAKQEYRVHQPVVMYSLKRPLKGAKV
jgi:hypothetical protein